MFFLYHFELKGNKLNIIKCSFLLSSFVSFFFCDVTLKSLESLTENDRNINLQAFIKSQKIKHHGSVNETGSKVATSE